ncbi:MAG: hypothetical protein ACJ79H_10190 [Myxococcales bacterium]
MSGTFQTTYWTDDGTKTTLPGAPGFVGGFAATSAALLVPDTSGAGYAESTFTLDATKSFRVTGVPVGTYFLKMAASRTFLANCGTGMIEVNTPFLFDAASSTPDLGNVTGARPDLARPVSTAPTEITFSFTGMDPWVAGDRIQLASAQGLTNQRAISSPVPSAGATTFSGTSPWFSEGLPDAAKGDVVFVYQRATISIGSGAGTAAFHRATRFDRRTDFTVADGTKSSVTAALAAAPQTGSVTVDLRGEQFAALAADVAPGAVVSSGGMVVLAVPHSVTYPDMPIFEETPVAFLETSSAADANYGALAYGRFLDPFWQDVRRVFYVFDATPGGQDAIVESDLPVSALAAGPIVPVLSPPKTPRVNGNDAFAARTDVGLQPTISWSAPTLGAPTSYTVEVLPATLELPCTVAGQTVGVTATVHGATSFKVPPGMLKPGISYRATITAFQAPWDTQDAGPFRTGAPSHFAQCVTATFTP